MCIFMVIVKNKIKKSVLLKIHEGNKFCDFHCHSAMWLLLHPSTSAQALGGACTDLDCEALAAAKMTVSSKT